MRGYVVGRAGMEMSADPRFLPRVRRLTAVSAVALGVIWVLAVTTLDAHPVIELALLTGWLLMPMVLGASLRWPGVRAAVAAPATLISAALLVVCITDLPENGPARLGWILTTVGVMFGGVLGAWFWYRWFPVPSSLEAPWSPGRWILIGVHVAAIVGGIALISLDAIP